MSTIGEYLKEIKAKLEEIPNIKTVGVGLEKGIGSKDCPFIRIVPENNAPSSKIKSNCAVPKVDDMTIKVVFGFDLKNKELELLYDEYYNLESEIRDKLSQKFSTGHIKFLHTVTDEDELQSIKSAISRFEIIGIR